MLPTVASVVPGCYVVGWLRFDLIAPRCCCWYSRCYELVTVLLRYVVGQYVVDLIDCCIAFPADFVVTLRCFGPTRCPHSWRTLQLHLRVPHRLPVVVTFDFVG